MQNQAKYYKRNLPHYYVPGACYFVTCRLYNSLPANKTKQLEEKYKINKCKIKSMKLSQSEEIKKLNSNWEEYFYRIDKLLHKNINSLQYLHQPDIAKLIVSALEYYDNVDYELSCFCIMSNHLHIVFTLLEQSRPLEKIMFSIKRYSSGQANKILDRKGQFWQHESYDHIVRNKQEFNRIINYVLNNPVEAGLVDHWEKFKWNYLKDIDIL